MTRRGRSLAVALLCATGALILVSASVGHCDEDEVALSAGAVISAGIGEQPYSPTFGIRARRGAIEGAASYDWTHKLESGRGWIAGFDLDGYLGPIILGADYRHRNGGPWTKRVAFAHVGLALGRHTRLTYRHEFYSTATPSNEDRLLELRSRYRFGNGVFIESLIAGTTFLDMDGSRTYGTYGQISVGRRWGR